MFVRSLLFSLITAASVLAAPRAVVFDFGGVMTKEPNRQAVVDFLCDSFQMTASEFEQVNQEKKQALKCGMTDEAFWIQFAKEHEVTLPPDWVDKFKDVLKMAIGINEEMYALVDQLKAKNICIAMLSNIDSRLARMIREFGLYQPFHPCLLSCELGIEKPSPKAFEMTMEALKLPAGEIVFIDDHIDNVETAKTLGFDAILFTSVEQIRQDLKTRELL